MGLASDRAYAKRGGISSHVAQSPASWVCGDGGFRHKYELLIVENYEFITSVLQFPE